MFGVQRRPTVNKLIKVQKSSTCNVEKVIKSRS